MQKAKQITYILLRIVTGFLFFQHGGQKMFGWYGGMSPEGGSLPPMMVVAGVLEFVGGLAIMLGLFTRPVAFLLCGEMAVAYFQAHFPNGPLPLQNHGEPAVLFCFIFLFFAAHGAGSFSMDEVMQRGRMPKS